MFRPASVRLALAFLVSLFVSLPVAAQSSDSTAIKAAAPSEADAQAVEAAYPHREEGLEGAHARGGSGDGRATTAPPLQTFATDPNLTGAIANSVNLHTGDVTLPITLLSLSGKEGLGINVSALYSSNVHRQVASKPEFAPSGVLGTGWSLGFDRVIVDHKNTGTRTDDDYYLVTGGQTLPLVFGSLVVAAEGTYREFESTSYQFWDIRYYTSSEKWVVTKEDGAQYEFGVEDAGTERCSDDPDNERNTVDWAIKWGNYIGDSSQPDGQECFAVAWNLRRVTNLWGDEVNYYYSAERELLGNGKGTNGSLMYTKAAHLAAIVGSEGSTVSFVYEDKCDENGEGDCQGYTGWPEVVDPHIEESEPDAYQETYGTQFLKRIDVTNPSGAALLHVDLEYERHYSTAAARKRQLVSVTHRAPNGETLPPLEFKYYGYDKTNPLALEEVTLPQGGTATFAYDTVSLGAAQRDRMLTAPSGYSRPRVWVAGDYVVVTWWKEQSSATDLVRVEAYRWNGRWEGGYVDSVNAELLTSGTHDGKQDFEVVVEEDFFALVTKYWSDSNYRYAYLYRKDPTRPDKWLASGSKSVYIGGGPVQLVSGDDFAAVVSTRHGRIGIYTKDQGDWTSAFPWNYYEGSDDPDFFAAAKNNYFALYNNDGTDEAWIHFLDEDGVWIRKGIDLSGFDGDEGMALHAGDGHLVITRADNSERILRWDESFNPTPLVYADNVSAYSRVFNNAEQAALVNSQSANDYSQLRRFDGAGWQSREVATGYGSWLAAGYDFVLAYQGVPGLRRFEFDPNALSYTLDTSIELMGDGINLSPFPTAGHGFFAVWSLADDPDSPVDIYVRKRDGQWDGHFEDTGLEPTYNDFTYAGADFIAYQRTIGANRQAHIRHIVNGSADKSYKTIISGGIYGGDQYQSHGLVGSQTVITYDGSALWSSTGLNLHRIIADGSTGSIEDYPVTSVTIDDGYQQQESAYCYTTTTAGADPSGSVARYNQVKVIPGTTDCTAVSTYGHTITRFFNGSDPASLPGVPAEIADLGHSHGSNMRDHYGVLVGLPYQTIAYNHTGKTEVSSSKTWYKTYEQTLSNGSPAYYTRSVQSVRQRQGIESKTSNKYERGLLKQSNQWVHGSDGQELRYVTEYRRFYDYSGYSTNGPLNFLAPVIQTRSYAADASGNPIANSYSVSATRWKAWGSGDTDWAPYESYVHAAKTNGSFSAWDEGSNPSVNWQLTSRIVSRTDGGPIREVEEATGIPHATVYEGYESYGGELLPAATFSNASVSDDPTGTDASYLGFESGIEIDHKPENDYWGFYDENDFSEDAHTGRYSRVLYGNTSKWGPTRDFEPTDQSGVYVASAWVKTPAGFGANKGALHLEACSPGSCSGPYPGVEEANATVSFGSTNGEWRYVEAVIDLAAARDGGASGTLRLHVYVDNKYTPADPGPDLLVDDVRVSPLESSFRATVYDPTSLQPTAVHGANGAVSHMENDAFGQPVEVRDRRGRVVAESFGGLSRELSSDEFFDPQEPNRSTSKSFPLANPVVNGSFELGVEASNGQPVGWPWGNPNASYSLGAGYTGAHALRITASESTSSGDHASVVGRLYDQSFYKTNTTYTYTFWARCETNGQGSSCPINVGAYRREASGSWEAQAWVQRSITGDSWKQYSGTFTTDADVDWDRTDYVSGLYISLETALQTIHVDDVQFYEGTTFAPPTISTTFSDGAGKPRQTQAPGNGGVLVSETLYDQLGRAVGQTKTALVSGADFAYRPGFVSDGPDGSFGARSTSSSLGVMTGEVAQAHPEAGGYPYTQVVFERTPLARKEEQSNFGADYRIGAGRTVRYTYQINSGNDGFRDDLPSAQYFQTRMEDPDDNVSFTLTDELGRTIATQAPSLTLADGSQVKPTTSYDFDVRGDVTRVRTPNDLSGNTFATDTYYDWAGRPVLTETPDEGTTEFVYDAAGRPRFMQDEDLEDQNRIVYTKYDALGRPIETGHKFYVSTSGMPGLANEANNPDWPESGGVWRTRWAYDYVAGETGNQGRIVRQESSSDDDATAEAWETYAYDADGHLERVALKVPEFDGSEHAVRYAYNDRGDVTRVVAGDTETSENVTTYSYDRLGRIEAVQSGNSVTNSIGYRYRPDGALRQRVHGHSPFMWVHYDYDAQGRLTQIGNGYFTETLTYTSGRYGDPNEGYHRGLIASATFDYGGSANGLDHTYRYAYDDLGQLSVAHHEGTSTTTSYTYDANGNITRRVEGLTVTPYAYTAGTNRLNNTDGSGTDYGYDGRGNITSASPRGITEIAYDPVLNLPVSLEKGSTTTLYRYLGSRRVLKRGSASTATRTLYVHGAGEVPLYEVTREYDDGDSEVEFLTGGSGSTDDGTGPSVARESAGGEGSLARGTLAASAAKGPKGTWRTTTTYYVHGPDGLVATRVKGQSSSLRYVVADHLGSTRVVLDQYGGIESAFAYDAWGQRIEMYGPADPAYQYTGQEMDAEAGLMNYRARLYDPAIGRFYGVDPAGEFASPYLYAGNNPLSFTDPTGEFIVEAMLIGAFIGGVSSAIQGDSFTEIAANAAVGGLAGAVGAGVGAGVSSAIAGGSFIAGATGTSSVAATGFIAGAASGAAGGLAGGFVSGVGTGLVGGSSLGGALGDGLRSGLIGAGTGGVIGGVSAGIHAVRNDLNFFTGKGTFDLSQGIGAHDLVDLDLPVTGKYVGKFEGVNVYEADIGGGIALPGRGIVVRNGVFTRRLDIPLLRHEFGHILQAREVGIVAFYRTIGKESLASAALDVSTRGRWDHSTFWTETWANYKASNYFSSVAWPVQRFPVRDISNFNLFRLKLSSPFFWP